MKRPGYTPQEWEPLKKSLPGPSLKKGRFELDDKCTLFLDEIGNLTLRGFSPAS